MQAFRSRKIKIVSIGFRSLGRESRASCQFRASSKSLCRNPGLEHSFIFFSPSKPVNFKILIESLENQPAIHAIVLLFFNSL